MAKSFQELLDLYLTEKSKHPDLKAEEIIESVNNQEGIDASKTKQVLNECKTLDDIHSAYNDLQQALRDGLTKEEWLEDCIKDVTKNMSAKEVESFQNNILEKLDEIIETNGALTSNTAEQTINNTNTQKAKKDVTAN